MRPKMPILLYCADRELLSATAFALRLQPYDVDCHRRQPQRRCHHDGEPLACGILIHARQGDLAGRLIHRLLEADLHVPSIAGRPCRRSRTRPLRRHGALRPQYLDGAHPRRSQCALRAEARTTSTECGVRYLSVCSGIEAVSVAWQTARLAARHVRRDRSLLLLAAALALSRIAAYVHAESA